eukprot:m.101603 g.101603  ORF g.101603 m.101603 type:complete len:58 (+) comp8970_c0_seq2:700-873(+)
MNWEGSLVFLTCAAKFIAKATVANTNTTEDSEGTRDAFASFLKQVRTFVTEQRTNLM